MTAMADRAVIGSQWTRRRDKTTWRIYQVHRVDRLAELVPAERTNASQDGKQYVPFPDLRRKYSEVSTASADTGAARAPRMPRAGKPSA